MKKPENIPTDKEMELVNLLMQDCQSTGDIRSKLKRLFAGTIEKMLKAGMNEHLARCPMLGFYIFLYWHHLETRMHYLSVEIFV